MHKSFILFIKLELKIYIQLETTSEMISFLEIIVFLVRVRDIKTYFLNSLALGACIRGTYVEVAYFTGSTYVKDTSIEGISIEGTGTKDIDTEVTYTRGACIEIISSTGIESACI